MAWRHLRIGILAIILVSGAVLAWLVFVPKQTPPVEEPVESSAPSADLTGRSIYTNGEYGFIVSYPDTAQLEETFAPRYLSGSAWRVHALPDVSGTPLLAIIGYSTESDHSYPRSYTAMVRIGATNDTREVARCLSVSSESGETALPDVTMNGTIWKVFAFSDAATMHYVRGVSYRTLHDGYCVAVEKIAEGSSYREDPASADDVSDTLLAERYAGLGAIVETFTFVRP